VVATTVPVVAKTARVVAKTGQRAACLWAGARLLHGDEAARGPAQVDGPAEVVRLTLDAERRRAGHRNADSWSRPARRRACGWCSSSEPPPRGTPRNRLRLLEWCHSWDSAG
jgi:hypothetical protein